MRDKNTNGEYKKVSEKATNIRLSIFFIILLVAKSKAKVTYVFLLHLGQPTSLT